MANWTDRPSIRKTPDHTKLAYPMERGRDRLASVEGSVDRSPQIRM